MIAALRNRVLLPLAVIALVQTAVLAGMVIDRVHLLGSGREITLPIVPVDPRDLFRGEYVRLGYGVSTLPLQQFEGPRPFDNASFYVVLGRRPDGSWHTLKALRDMPQETSPDRIVLKGRTSHWPAVDYPNATVRVRYGIESYFVPEGQGKKLEDLAREKKLATLVAVDSRGNAAIKALIVDGVLQYEEPIF
jgi:uncharacterized membrane-anchored protein